MRRGLPSLGTAALVALLAIGCSEHEAEDDDAHSLSGPNAVTPTPSPTPAPTPAASPTPTATTVAYTPDIQPILKMDCTRCHSSFSSYAGTMGFVRPGDPSSPLVGATQPGGSMYSYLSGDASAKAELIRSWVVDNGAVESR
jgi:hypothetical protein